LPQHRRLARTATYFGGPEDGLFGWYHHGSEAPARDCVAVLCPPFGAEYSSCHRTFRHLADALARRGIPALRFDYHGTGDSPGNDLDPNRIARWQDDIAAAIAHARAASGRPAVCLVGVRMGATLAAMATNSSEVELAVLWNPCVRGKAYVRELQAVASTAERPARPVAGELECAGFVLSAETLESMRQIDLTREPVRIGRRALLVWRDDQSPDPSLETRFSALGIDNDTEVLPGWSGMLAEPHYTEVPEGTLETIAGWVVRQSAVLQSPAARAPEPEKTITLGPAMQEHLCAFGAGDRLFGVLTQGSSKGDTAIVMPNAGAVHHVGPNRLYVGLARELAAYGFPSLRFDIRGLGDSVREDGAENNTYPEWAVRDTFAAMDHLKERFGYSRFVVMGLCSGAHTAFHAGLEAERHEVAGLVLINPLTYRWQEGMSLEAARQFTAVEQYRKSARDPGRWLKLVRGEVALGYAAKVAFNHFLATVKSNFEALRETIQPAKASELSRDLRRLFSARRRVALVISEGDPGAEMLFAGARRAATQAIRSGAIELRYIEGADHTFSQLASRRELADYLREMFVSHHSGGRFPGARARSGSGGRGPERHRHGEVEGLQLGAEGRGGREG
jgi:alpha-beta hydrolase superfamily lysophospholipase